MRNLTSEELNQVSGAGDFHPKVEHKKKFEKPHHKEKKKKVEHKPFEHKKKTY